MPPPPKQPHPDALSLSRHMSALKLPFMLENHQAYAQSAADKHWSHLAVTGSPGETVRAQVLSPQGKVRPHPVSLGHNLARIQENHPACAARLASRVKRSAASSRKKKPNFGF